jgi:hypothetical protein
LLVAHYLVIFTQFKKVKSQLFLVDFKSRLKKDTLNARIVLGYFSAIIFCIYIKSIVDNFIVKYFT